MAEEVPRGEEVGAQGEEVGFANQEEPEYENFDHAQRMEWSDSEEEQRENVSGASGDSNDENSNTSQEEEMEVDNPDTYEGANGYIFKLIRKRIRCPIHNHFMHPIYQCVACGLLLQGPQIDQHAAEVHCCCHWNPELFEEPSQ